MHRELNISLDLKKHKYLYLFIFCTQYRPVACALDFGLENEANQFFYNEDVLMD